MHVLTVEEEPQEGMTPGDGNDREYMGRLQDLVVDCLVGNPPREELHQRLQDGVWGLLQDLFGNGSIVSLQADGGPAEYTIRVRF